MTPMVDLGFLLITFFVFTSALSEPTLLQLAMPSDYREATPVKETGALTLLPVSEQMVYYYEGQFQPGAVRKATVKDIRSVIINKKAHTPQDDLFVIIKPTAQARYRLVIDMLDEMTISQVARYALVKITPDESAIISSYTLNNPDNNGR